MTHHGLVNDDVRKRVWPLLLNVELIREEEDSQIMDSSRSSNGKSPSSGNLTSKNTFRFYRIAEESAWKSIIYPSLVNQ